MSAPVGRPRKIGLPRQAPQEAMTGLDGLLATRADASPLIAAALAMDLPVLCTGDGMHALKPSAGRSPRRDRSGARPRRGGRTVVPSNLHRAGQQAGGSGRLGRVRPRKQPPLEGPQGGTAVAVPDGLGLRVGGRGHRGAGEPLPPMDRRRPVSTPAPRRDSSPFR